MEVFLYSPLDIAVIINSLNVGIQEQNRILNVVWSVDKSYLNYRYWYDKKKFFLDVYYWLNYITNKKNIDDEFSIIKSDVSSVNGTIDKNDFVTDYKNLDLFFKKVRIMLITHPEKSYTAIKLRTLLKRYGYERRTQKLVGHFRTCLEVYHLQSYLKGGEVCDLGKVQLDKMIIFRLIY